MKRKPKLSFFLFLFTSILFWSGLTGQALALMFHIEITNLSPNVLSPTAFITHDAGFDLFDGGSAASAAVELLAETGNNSLVLAEAASSGSVLDYVGASGGPIAQSLSYMVMIDADISHPLLSFMSMMGVSNDGFIGGTTGDGSISLYSGGLPISGTYIIMPANVWDAGTEVNDEASGSVGALGAGPTDGIDENGVIFQPHLGIIGIGDIPIGYDWTDSAVAQIDIKAAPVPEPATLLLIGAGLAGIAGFRRKQCVKK